VQVQKSAFVFLNTSLWHPRGSHRPSVVFSHSAVQDRGSTDGYHCVCVSSAPWLMENPVTQLAGDGGVKYYPESKCTVVMHKDGWTEIEKLLETESVQSLVEKKLVAITQTGPYVEIVFKNHSPQQMKRRDVYEFKKPRVASEYFEYRLKPLLSEVRRSYVPLLHHIKLGEKFALRQPSQTAKEEDKIRTRGFSKFCECRQQKPIKNPVIRVPRNLVFDNNDVNTWVAEVVKKRKRDMAGQMPCLN
jgi:hypothetical protein